MLDPHSHRRPIDSPNIYSHSRSRTTSSNTFPLPIQAPMPMNLPPPHQHSSRRSPSINTFSTTSTVPPPAAYRTSPTSDLRRSTSSRSGGHSAQPSGYVALLRKQKATVWCDRSQYEDPRLIAAHRAAKVRATLEVVGGGQRTASGNLSAPSRATTGISAAGKVTAKIRHHGKPAVVGYAPGANHVGVGGVPMRLSATEVEGESSDDDTDPTAPGIGIHHRRTGSSGRSSMASRRGVQYRSSGGAGQRWSPGDTPERGSSIMEEQIPSGPDFVVDDTASGKARSVASGSSSAERADAVGELGGGGSGGAARLASNSLMNAAVTREKSVKSAEDLKRRGSVDERTTSLTTTGRLYIANPD